MSLLSVGALTGQGSSRKILDTCGTPQYGQCGGMSCPGPTQCEDRDVGCCPSGFSCSRQSAYYWQCVPSNTSAPTPTPTLTPAQTISAADAKGERSLKAEPLQACTAAKSAPGTHMQARHVCVSACRIVGPRLRWLGAKHVRSMWRGEQLP